VAAASVFEDRLARARRFMAEHEVRALILFPSVNMQYMTGLRVHADERLLLAIIPAEGEATLLVPALQEELVRSSTWVEDLRVWDDAADPVALLRDVLAGQGLTAAPLAVDDRMWARFVLMLQWAAPKARLGTAGRVLRELRMRKSRQELELLRRAATVADEAFTAVLSRIRPGLTEAEVAWLLEQEMRSRGGEGNSFAPLVAAGPNGSMPHHRTGERRLEATDVVVMDFGCTCGGYCSDITRTVCLGEVPEEVRRVYEVVAQAQDAGVAAVRPENTCEAVDRATRQVIEEAGMGRWFIHRTGHGIGLEGHEDPYVVEGNARPLEPGMTFSVEPGVYIPGEFGVRLEDIVEVTAAGGERLNHAGRDLVCL